MGSSVTICKQDQYVWLSMMTNSAGVIFKFFIKKRVVWFFSDEFGKIFPLGIYRYLHKINGLTPSEWHQSPRGSSSKILDDDEWWMQPCMHACMPAGSHCHHHWYMLLAAAGDAHAHWIARSCPVSIVVFCPRFSPLSSLANIIALKPVCLVLVLVAPCPCLVVWPLRRSPRSCRPCQVVSQAANQPFYLLPLLRCFGCKKDSENRRVSPAIRLSLLRSDLTYCVRETSFYITLFNLDSTCSHLVFFWHFIIISTFTFTSITIPHHIQQQQQ